jgi:hypothetical protein
MPYGAFGKNRREAFNWVERAIKVVGLREVFVLHKPFSVVGGAPHLR